MQLSPEQENMIEEQKKNCPFCKIIKGEIPSKKVYEDNDLVAILDINPATDGHVLLMPKNHYPILPFMPDETFRKLFNAAVNLSDILKVTFTRSGTTLFIANGASAGQQSPHFMIHMFARDPNDLEKLNLEGKSIDPEKHKEVTRILKHNLPVMLKDDSAKYPLDKPDNPSEDTQAQQQQQDGIDGSTKEQMKQEVLRIIEQNPDLKKMIIEKSDTVKQNIPTHPQLSKMFQFVDFDEVVDMIKGESEEPEEEIIVEDAPSREELQDILGDQNLEEVVEKEIPKEKKEDKKKEESSEEKPEFKEEKPEFDEDLTNHGAEKDKKAAKEEIVAEKNQSLNEEDPEMKKTEMPDSETKEHEGKADSNKKDSDEDNKDRKTINVLKMQRKKKSRPNLDRIAGLFK